MVAFGLWWQIWVLGAEPLYFPKTKIFINLVHYRRMWSYNLTKITQYLKNGSSHDYYHSVWCFSKKTQNVGHLSNMDFYINYDTFIPWDTLEEWSCFCRLTQKRYPGEYVCERKNKLHTEFLFIKKKLSTHTCFCIPWVFLEKYIQIDNLPPKKGITRCFFYY